jgi:hypothetical protein
MRKGDIMKLIRIAVPVGLVVASLACSGGVEDPSLGTTSVDLSRACKWTVVPSPNVGMSDNSLSSVDGDSPGNIWAVGSLVPDSNPDITSTLIQHYNGTRWTVFPSPNVGTQANSLNSVAAIPGRPVAVGFYIDDQTFSPQSLIERFDGHQWQVIDHPHAGISDELSAISAISSSDVWAVGFQRDSSGQFHTLTEHYSGGAWSVVPSPNPGSFGNQLFGVAAVSANDVWAVGGQVGSKAPDGALILHWNGTAWSDVTAPTDGALSTNLFAVASFSSSSNAQAVGDAHNNRSGSRALVESGNTQWRLVSAPSVGTGDNHLYGIALDTANLGWAVGSFLDPAGNMETLVLAGGDSGWSRVPIPSPSTTGDSVLGGVTLVGGTDVWAVGAFDGANALQTLVEHCH